MHLGTRRQQLKISSVKLPVLWANFNAGKDESKAWRYQRAHTDDIIELQQLLKRYYDLSSQLRSISSIWKKRPTDNLKFLSNRSNSVVTRTQVRLPSQSCCAQLRTQHFSNGLCSKTQASVVLCPLGNSTKWRVGPEMCSAPGSFPNLRRKKTVTVNWLFPAKDKHNRTFNLEEYSKKKRIVFHNPIATTTGSNCQRSPIDYNLHKAGRLPALEAPTLTMHWRQHLFDKLRRIFWTRLGYAFADVHKEFLNMRFGFAAHWAV